MAKSHYGFKLSISVDREHKLIRKRVTDTASVHDSRHFDCVLDDWNTSAEVYAPTVAIPVRSGKRCSRPRVTAITFSARAAAITLYPSARKGETTGSPRSAPGSSMSLPPSSRWAASGSAPSVRPEPTSP